MLPAKHADPQIPSSTRVRTDCTSLLATLAALDEVSQLSRQVSLPRSVRDVDSKARFLASDKVVLQYGSLLKVCKSGLSIAKWWTVLLCSSKEPST